MGRLEITSNIRSLAQNNNKQPVLDSSACWLGQVGWWAGRFEWAGNDNIEHAIQYNDAMHCSGLQHVDVQDPAMHLVMMFVTTDL